MEVSEISATDGVLPGAGEPSAAQYHLSSSWRLEKTNDQWLLYGGDDAKFEIEPIQNRQHQLDKNRRGILV